jgi:hypothetical protein
MFDESNLSIVPCSARFEEVLDCRALHVAKIRQRVLTHLIRRRLQTGQTVQVPQTYPLTSPQHSQPLSSRTKSIATKISTSDTAMLRLAPLFHEVLKSVPGASQSQTVYKYREMIQLLSEFILVNRNKLFHPRHLKLAIVSGDPLGAAFSIKSFHQCQVALLINFPLKSFVLGPSGLSSTSRGATMKKVQMSKKRKVVKLDDDMDSGEQRPQSGDREGPN